MNYDNAELTEQLARRYVIGLMRGKARLRFSLLLQSNPSLSQQVVYWEDKFNHLNDQIRPVQPPKKIWKIISNRLFSSTRQRFDLWHWLGAIGSTAAIVLAVFLFQQPLSTSLPTTNRVAVIQNEQQKSLWVLNISDSVIEAIPQASIEPQADKNYELWMLPVDGSNPVSLGLLPERGRAMILTPPPAFKLAQVAGLAVSVEPLGGSTTGLPTGPVVYSTDIARL
ncbi:hypothetical protein A28LD_0385 [Idiomarina sp. A28L]|uniref:anti-sigma factor n=1 Tax=Idiomarina sp. A28L TaxID=1036674 RepID=UPI0002138A82|nr:anti-sigma factor [Idiomarina sp. A28L]EGN75897.1 hypothetical protein A28LD_0385 [Idiomarina sp. A28L]